MRDVTAINTTGGTTTLTDEQEEVNVIHVSGALVSNATIVFAGERGRVWIVTNATTGAFTVTFKVTGQAGVTVTQGMTKNVYSNGRDIADAGSTLHEDDAWLLIRHFYEGVLESARGDRYRISSVDRAGRRKALSEIFAILGARTFRHRLMATRVIVQGITDYRYKSLLEISRAKDRRWFKQVASHSKALAKLAGAHPRDFAYHVMDHSSEPEDAKGAIEELLRWAEAARRNWIVKLSPPGMTRRVQRMPRRADKRRIYLIDHVEQLYRLATGRVVSEWCDIVTGEPGPFVRFMGAVWNLAGVDRKKLTIVKDIKMEWKREYFAHRDN